MTKVLSPQQIERYQTQGAIAPIRIMDADTAFQYRRQFEALGGKLYLIQKAKLYLIQVAKTPQWCRPSAAPGRLDLDVLL